MSESRQGAAPDFTGNLQKQAFARQDLRGARFRDADLRGAQFDGALLNAAIFENCFAAEATFAGAQCGQMRARASSFYLADFRNADLRGAVLEQCVFAGADLRGARLTGITLTLDCNTFEEARIDRATSAELAYLFARAQSPHRERWLELIGERDRAWLESVFSR